MAIELLPGAKLTPEVLLHTVLEDAPKLKGVLVITIDQEDQMQATWSQLPVAWLAMAAMFLDERVRRTVIPEE